MGLRWGGVWVGELFQVVVIGLNTTATFTAATHELGVMLRLFAVLVCSPHMYRVRSMCTSVRLWVVLIAIQMSAPSFDLNSIHVL